MGRLGALVWMLCSLGCTITTLRAPAIESVVARRAGDPPPEKLRATGLSLPAGERIEAEVWLQGMGVGRYVWQTERTCELGRREVRPVRSQASGGLMGLFDSGAELGSWIDTGDGMPLYTTSHLSAPLTERDYRVDFRGAGYHSVYRRTVAGNEAIRDKRYKLPRGEKAHDMHSLVVALRRWSPKQDARGYAYLVMGTRLWRADFVFLGAEILELPDRSEPSVRIEGVARKLSRAALKPVADTVPRTFSLWLSDDKRRVPLRAVAQSDKFATRMQLSSYSRSEVDDAHPAPCEL